MGINVNLWFGALILLVAYALISYALLAWLHRRHFAWRVLIVVGLGALLFFVAGRQLVSQYYVAHPDGQAIALQVSPNWLASPLLFAILTVALILLRYSRAKVIAIQQSADTEAIEKLQADNAALVTEKTEIETKLKEIEIQATGTQTVFDTDKARIKNLVRLCAIYYMTHFDSNERLQKFVTFTFFIFNISLYDIVISGSLPDDSSIQFGIQGDTFSRSCEIDGKKPKLCPARGGCNVTVRQYVDKEEIDEIERAKDMYFWFANLGMTFKLAKEPQGEPIPLKISQTFQPKNGIWNIIDQPEYVFALNDEQWAEAIKGKSMETVKELSKSAWLREIAKGQAESILSFVQITKPTFGKYELFRSDPYLEFQLSVDNRSVYDLALCEKLVGSISYLNREFSSAVTWIDRPVLTHVNVSTITIRQALTREDVSHILSGAEAVHFDFSRLQIEFESHADFKEDVSSKSLHVHHLLLNNADLVKAYPKLEINLLQSVYGFLLDERPVLPKTEPTLVTLLLWIQNWRSFTVEVKSFKLRVSVNGKQYVGYAASGDELHAEFEVNRCGQEVGIGPAVRNLNAAGSLTLIENQRERGALQFRFPELQFFDIEHDELNGAPFTLTLIDANDEKHHQNGTIKDTMGSRNQPD